MAFPFGFTELSPNDLKRFRRLYEESVKVQPLDELGAWYLDTYADVQAGEFTEALNRLEWVFEKSPDFAGFLAAKHLLSKVQPRSGVSYQVAKRLLVQSSPLLCRYGLCLVIAGEVLIDREITDAIARSSAPDLETMEFAAIAKLSIQIGASRHV